MAQRVLNGGAECPELTQSRECTGTHCPVDCVLSDVTYTPCDAQCDDGQTDTATGSMSGTRVVQVKKQNGGQDCDYSQLRTSKQCTITGCPVHCQVRT